MRLAIPYWQGRVSPVLDVAGSLLLVDLVHGSPVVTGPIALLYGTPLERARRMTELGIDTLICGAISRPLEMALLHSGIEVISQICGEVDVVIDAFQNGRIQQDIFSMPGCRGSQRRFRWGRGRGGRP